MFAYMKNKSQIRNAFLILIEFLFWLILVIGFTLLFGNLVNSYWLYNDLGIGSGANTFALWIGYLPPMFIVLAITVPISNVVLQKRKVPYWLVIIITVFIMILLIGIGFLKEVWHTSSSIHNLDLIDFFNNYVHGTLLE